MLICSNLMVSVLHNIIVVSCKKSNSQGQGKNSASRSLVGQDAALLQFPILILCLHFDIYMNILTEFTKYNSSHF